MGVGRAALAAVGCLVASSLLSGCSPVVSGTVGITTTDAGRLEIVVVTCGRAVDWLTVTGSSRGSSTSGVQARWDADPAAAPGTVTRVPNDGSAAPWTLSTAPLGAATTDLDPGWVYSAWAGSDGNLLDGAVRTRAVTATGTDLAALRPGYAIVPLEEEPVRVDTYVAGACAGESGT
ncbi:MAG: hypothetical protein U0S36_03885 [Candidatus Nanopelagicales bacterium]